MSLNYDQFACQYDIYRKPDYRINASIQSHIDGSDWILNVGAGVGSYEPENGHVIAIEPSFEMISKRENSGTKPIQGVAEHLPFKNNVFDCSMAVLTIHHWSNFEAGLKEMLRVTKNKIILFTWIRNDNRFWLEDYIPEISGKDGALFPDLEELDRILCGITVETIEIPYDCTDGFMCAYWRRPEAYLNPDIRKAISVFSGITDVDAKLSKLHEDIKNGVWLQNNKHLLDKETMDYGYRLVIHENNLS